MFKKYCFFSFFLGFFLSAQATQSSSFQYTTYLGGTDTFIHSNAINLIDETDALVPSGSNPHTDFTWGLGAAYHAQPPAFIQHYNLFSDISLGLDFFYFKTQQDGDVWQYQLSNMNNFTYHMPIHSLRLMVDTEWTLMPLKYNISPFIGGGVGFARNTASFYEVPIATYEGQGLIIENNSQYQFAYTVSGGIKIPLNTNVQISARYLYTGLGRVVTSQTANFPLTSAISAGLYTHTWVFGLTYLV